MYAFKFLLPPLTKEHKTFSVSCLLISFINYYSYALSGSIAIDSKLYQSMHFSYPGSVETLHSLRSNGYFSPFYAPKYEVSITHA